MAETAASRIPKAPAGCKAAGKRLWRAVLGTYDLDEHELVLLVQAVHVADVCEDLQQIVDQDGPLTSHRERAHPAAVELRQQRIVLARLIVALRVPIGDQEQTSKSGSNRLQRRGARGVYTITGGQAS